MNIIIKRYSNRKLYDTTNKCFTTLNNIARMINAGDIVKVIDKNGEDVTDHVISTLIQKHFDHNRQLLDISGESPLDLIKNKINMIKVKRSLEVIYDLLKLASTDRDILNKIVNKLTDEGVINAEIAIDVEKTLYDILKERNVKIEKAIVESEQRKIWNELLKLTGLLSYDELIVYIKSKASDNIVDPKEAAKSLNWSLEHFENVRDNLVRKHFLNVKQKGGIESWIWTIP
ncbi:polyhydroxyalkanoate synthesis regulator DNA-binding domain-containing protein [Athalassotoga saccharophila]|uniref:PHA accumulation regulator DNA-binding N-terminal domain-containing protein n=1 Tax=Athalassotoga saccharophila TaxID=1441386 RepID=A0A6N4TDR9_9BACT|nr:polyhydroxyalkanoate synthesis regulator DNA-binding domain-containing protein [Athalassotoga saccharophila]BBJ29120.1 hypothetical protein ATHSA_p20030 [Athalassotoga saccharophila]